jgi:hypothetical protein
MTIGVLAEKIKALFPPPLLFSLWSHLSDLALLHRRTVHGRFQLLSRGAVLVENRVVLVYLSVERHDEPTVSVHQRVVVNRDATRRAMTWILPLNLAFLPPNAP